MKQKTIRQGIIYLLISMALIAIFVTVFKPYSKETLVKISEVIADVQKNQVQKIVVDKDDLKVFLKSGETVRSKKESGVSIYATLVNAGVSPEAAGAVTVEVKVASSWSTVFSILINFLPLIFFLGLIFFIMRQAQGTNSQAMNFARSKARMFVASKQNVTFADVAGVDEAKQELQEVVEFLKYPEKFSAIGARIPRGVLLVGPPGTGKTLLSRAVAGEAGVPFFSISGSEFVEMFVGVGASRVRDLFEQAKRNAPCIVFVDEIDAVGRHRGAGLGGGHDEREQTLNQMLVEMDGFESSTNVIVLAATNRPDILDPALLRPGRFDRRVVLDGPDIRGRVDILKVHAKGKPLESDINLETLAKQTPGFSGADLANLVNEAALLAARRNKKAIGMPEMEEAIDRIIAGPERKSRITSQREKEIKAYHEAGHALVAYSLRNEGADSVHKVTIVARGMMGGYTMMLPTEDRSLYSEKQFKARITVSLGGRASEIVTFNEATTGASDDLDKATRMARSMITEYGMSETLGPRTFGRKEGMVFLGREISEQRDYSEKIAEEIDAEIRRIIHSADDQAQRILTENKETLHRFSKALMQRETLDGEDLEILFRGEALPDLVITTPASPATVVQTPQAKHPAAPPVPKKNPEIQPA
ncbi:MAG: ATP-dependent metallopeptidase FtsH/Yme1/Tma family protein [Dehalococcoidia bacterium]|nr:ATP-dependent metallopeptidase FtsH/Yme1/Tma family protein [Dehalococcoidia bacterium]